MGTVECCRVPRRNIQSAEIPCYATRMRPNIKCEKGQILATVHIQGKPYTAVVDTGASKSFIREDLATIMRDAVIPRKPKKIYASPMAEFTMSRKRLTSTWTWVTAVSKPPFSFYLTLYIHLPLGWIFLVKFNALFHLEEILYPFKPTTLFRWRRWAR